MVDLFFSLSEESIDALIDTLKGIKKSKQKMASEITRLSLHQMKDYAQERVRKTVGKTGYPPTGELEQNFQIKRNRSKGTLKNVHPNSAAVEFGTGIVGESSPHPLAGEQSYQYDVNEHGEQGWDYGENHEFHTQGEVAHRFMYDSISMLETSGVLQEIGEKAFKKGFENVK